MHVNVRVHVNAPGADHARQRAGARQAHRPPTMHVNSAGIYRPWTSVRNNDARAAEMTPTVKTADPPNREKHSLELLLSSSTCFPLSEPVRVGGSSMSLSASRASC